MSQPRLILIGGFLGAGKTTLMSRAAARLMARGLKVGLITNDQAAALVDTEIARRITPEVREVAGGCFCCRFGDLVAALKSMFADFTPDVILAEPVGSCTDLSATVVQPFKALYAEMLDVAPFTVMLDPVRLREAFDAGDAGLMPKSVHYIFRKQMEEADLLALNKTDLLTRSERESVETLITAKFPGREAISISAREDAGVDAWLARVMSVAPAGQRIVEVDYDLYAQGEAELGWLNATAEVRLPKGETGADFCRRFLALTQDRLREKSADIAHLKVMLIARDKNVSGNVTGLQSQPRMTGDATCGGSPARFIINARVHLAPDELRAVVEEALRDVCGTTIPCRVRSLESFRPGRPKPTHRYAKVVG